MYLCSCIRCFVVVGGETPTKWQSLRKQKREPEYGELKQTPRKAKAREASEGTPSKRTRLSETCRNCGELEPDHSTDDCTAPRLENEGYLLAIGSTVFNRYRRQIIGEETENPDRCAVCAMALVPGSRHDPASCLKEAVFDAYWGGGFAVTLPNWDGQCKGRCPYCREVHPGKTSKVCMDEQVVRMQQFAGHKLYISNRVRELPRCKQCGNLVPDHDAENCTSPPQPNWGIDVVLKLGEDDLSDYIESIRACYFDNEGIRCPICQGEEQHDWMMCFNTLRVTINPAKKVELALGTIQEVRHFCPGCDKQYEADHDYEGCVDRRLENPLPGPGENEQITGEPQPPGPGNPEDRERETGLQVTNPGEEDEDEGILAILCTQCLSVGDHLVESCQWDPQLNPPLVQLYESKSAALKEEILHLIQGARPCRVCGKENNEWP